MFSGDYAFNFFVFCSEYEKLDPSDIIGNCSLAFETAESKLGIPALLDPEGTYIVNFEMKIST